jgi:hypothetical protein
MFKLHFNFRHIGDQVCTTGLPENIFHATGEKSVITDSSIWAFKHNPYVEFKTEEESQGLTTINLIPDCRVPQQAQHYFDTMKSFVSNGQIEYMCRNFGLENIVLRHPRLYIYEDEKIQPDKIVVHTSGSDRTRDKEPAIRYSSGEDSERYMSDEVIAAILENFRDYQIVQIGSKDDKPIGGHSIDRRGQYDYWQSAREIATSARFIGVNSGPMHIANCYPRVDKRIVLMEFPEATLLKHSPGDIRNWLFSWIDPTNTYYNKFNRDIGLTYSYKKI